MHKRPLYLWLQYLKVEKMYCAITVCNITTAGVVSQAMYMYVLYGNRLIDCTTHVIKPDNTC